MTNAAAQVGHSPIRSERFVCVLNHPCADLAHALVVARLARAKRAHAASFTTMLGHNERASTNGRRIASRACETRARQAAACLCGSASPWLRHSAAVDCNARGQGEIRDEQRIQVPSCDRRRWCPIIQCFGRIGRHGAKRGNGYRSARKAMGCRT